MNTKKIMLFGVLGLFAMGLVFAGVFYVNTINLTVSVGEPFDTIEYMILGNAGSYTDADGNCTNPQGDYSTGWLSEVDMQAALDGDVDAYLDAGESRKICVKIVNDADADIPYVVDFEVTGDGITPGSKALCQAAFSDISWTGLADKEDETIDGRELTVDSGAELVDNCQITVKVGRGTA